MGVYAKGGFLGGAHSVRPHGKAGRMPGHGFSDGVCTPLTTQSTFFLDPEPAVEIYLRGWAVMKKLVTGGAIMGAKGLLIGFLGALLLGHPGVGLGQGFEQEDRERLIRMEATLQVFMQQTDKRFAELREDMNKRFEEMRADVNKRFEEMREDTNKRFEQIDKRIEDLITFLWILAGIFTALVVAVIAFAYWDRRTIIRRAKEEAIREMEEAGRWKTILEALRQVAVKDANVAEALRKFNLL